MAQTKRLIADFGTFPTSYFNKRQKHYTVQDALGSATPSTPYIPTNVNPPFTTDATKARFNRSIPIDSVLNSASENEDDDSLDSGCSIRLIINQQFLLQLSSCHSGTSK